MKKTMIGWKESLSLPALGIDCLNVKVDTGAKTSALHTFSIVPFEREGQPWLRFGIHPIQDNTDVEIFCEAPVFDRRDVKDSGGHVECRYVIETEIVLGQIRKLIQLTLTDRDSMKFRMLLGREAMKGLFTVDPDASFLISSDALTK